MSGDDSLAPLLELVEQRRAERLMEWARSGEEPTLEVLGVLACTDPDSILLRDALVAERRRHGKLLAAAHDPWAVAS